MKTPRIIIADEDASYIAPLQQMIIEKLFERISLEIITNTDYFADVFSEFQEVDFLLISNSLYNDDLGKHHIKNIFLLTEDVSDEKPYPKNVKKIYKYSDINTIIDTLISVDERLSQLFVNNKSASIVLFVSASEVEKKTLTALELSKCLNNNGKKVLYLNAASLQSFQFSLRDESCLSTNKLYAQLRRDDIDPYSCVKDFIIKGYVTTNS